MTLPQGLRSELLAALFLLGCHPAIRATEVRGEVHQGGQYLKTGDIVATGDDLEVARGRVSLEIEGYGTVRVFNRTRVRVETSRRSTSIRLATGRLWAIITEPLGSKGFQVETANAVAGVRGTEFVVESQDDDTEVRVIAGEVAVTNPAHPDSTRMVRAKQRSSVRGQEMPTEPRAYDPGDDLGLWERLKALFKEVTHLAKDVAEAVDDEARKRAPEVKKGLQEGGRKVKDGLKELFDE